jgi:hypothetical protein
MTATEAFIRSALTAGIKAGGQTFIENLVTEMPTQHLVWIRNTVLKILETRGIKVEVVK